MRIGSLVPRVNAMLFHPECHGKSTAVMRRSQGQKPQSGTPRKDLHTDADLPVRLSSERTIQLRAMSDVYQTAHLKTSTEIMS